MNIALDTRFTYLKMTQIAATYESFSALFLQLDQHDRVGIRVTVPLYGIVDREICESSFAKQVLNVDGFSNLVYDKNETEAVVIKDLACALVPLCKNIYTDKDYGINSPLVISSCIGIGSRDTWHGSPSSNVNVIVSETMDKYVEGKETISQVVAMAVVASFTNFNLYKVPMTSVVIMCKRKLRVCMYNCESDTLLYSDEVPLTEVGVALLWAMLHFRYVRHVCPHTFILYTLYREFEIKGSAFSEEFQSKIPHYLSRGDNDPLGKFRSLKLTNINWTSRNRTEEGEEGEGFTTEMPTKKRVSGEP